MALVSSEHRSPGSIPGAFASLASCSSVFMLEFHSTDRSSATAPREPKEGSGSLRLAPLFQQFLQILDAILQKTRFCLGSPCLCHCLENCHPICLRCLPFLHFHILLLPLGHRKLTFCCEACAQLSFPSVSGGVLWSTGPCVGPDLAY